LESSAWLWRGYTHRVRLQPSVSLIVAADYLGDTPRLSFRCSVSCVARQEIDGAIAGIMRFSDARRQVSFTLLHPYASFFAHAAAEFTLGRYYCRSVVFSSLGAFVYLFWPSLSVVNSAFWPYHGLLLPPSFVLAIGWCDVMVNGAIAAMSSLPPIRDVFAIQV
jgi:hypothetical protein